ncbi:MAG: hypothetical protein ACHQ03_10970 [Candidatus Bathyarchaeia archaeon]
MPRRVPTRTTAPENQPPGFLANPFGRFAVTQRAHMSQQLVSSDVTKGLESVFVIENHPVVAAFIQRNRLHGLLLEAVAPLKAIFGEDIIKVLTLSTDDEGSENLYCLLLTPGSLVEAREYLRAFDERWWIEHSASSGGKLNFDFELI